MRYSYILTFLLLSQILYGKLTYEGVGKGFVKNGIRKSTFTYSLNPNKNNVGNSFINLGITGEKPIIQPNSDTEFEYSTNSKGTDIGIENAISFDGPSAFNCWVPDCNIIPGPEDLLMAINTKFRISDKDGNTISEISTNDWFSEFIGSGLVFDPKCIFDKSINRFIMTYLYYESTTGTSFMFLCVSDDSTAAGDWNIWALAGDLNGTVHDDVFPDFPTVTVSDSLIYWLNDMYPYNPPTGNPVYTKLRVIKKDNLLDTIAGPIIYKDLWGIKNPNNNQNVRTIKLVHNLSPSNDIFIVGTPNPTGSTQTSIYGYKVNDDFETLNITSFNIQCSPYSMPPHMLHLGGGKPMQLWFFFYTEMIQKNGIIYAAHSVKSSFPQFSEMHYMEIDTETFTLKEEFNLAKKNYSYGYPDLMADADGNVVMVYNRSGLTEYPGVFYSVKKVNNNFFSGDIPLQEGLGDLNAFCGNTSNPFIRFEDYTDIMFDPVDSNFIWLMGEYIDSDNKWKTKVGKINLDELLVTQVKESEKPNSFLLQQNFPNPFNPSTKIKYIIPSESFVTLSVFNSLGQKVSTLIQEMKPAGEHTIDYNADGLPSGVYFYQLNAGSYIETKKMILIK